jgi:membrane complex biogenesis BtpA family protein
MENYPGNLEASNMTWFSNVFGKEKVIIASLYLPPLPGTPDYRTGMTLDEMIEYVHNELEALQLGGMDGVSIGNQQDWPYQVGVGPETPALMSVVIREAMRGLSIPFGITVFWDDLAAIAVAKATGAAFVRGVFRGVYAGEMGLISLNAAETARYRRTLDAEGIKFMYMLRPILGRAVGERDVKAEVKDAVWGSKPDAFALCGPVPGEAPTFEELQSVGQAAKGLPVVMNNGANPKNIGEVFAVCDGAVIGTHLRKDHDPKKPFDRAVVEEFMDLVEQQRLAAV